MTAQVLPDLRYRQFGADPVAKQLWAAYVASLRAAEQVRLSLEQYLDTR